MQFLGVNLSLSDITIVQRSVILRNQVEIAHVQQMQYSVEARFSQQNPVGSVS